MAAELATAKADRAEEERKVNEKGCVPPRWIHLLSGWGTGFEQANMHDKG